MDASPALGPNRIGPSFGAGSWGDFNEDGLPDLWLNVHALKNRLYVNQGDGTFVDLFATMGVQRADTHGSMWADWDGDGDLDLYEVTGASGKPQGEDNRLVWIELPMFRNIAVPHGVDDPHGRGRSPQWLDWNHDGRLDLAVANYPSSQSANRLFWQDRDGLFQAAGPTEGFDQAPLTSRYVQLADLNDDKKLDLIYHGFSFPARAYDLNTMPLVRIDGRFRWLPNGDVHDSVFGDFNGDLRTDVYLTRFPHNRLSDALQRDARTVMARLRGEAEEIGIDVDVKGKVDFVFGSAFDLNILKIGSGGLNLGSFEFTLDPNNPDHQGLAPHVPGGDFGVYVGFDTVTKEWQVRASSDTRVEAWVIVQGGHDIRDWRTVNFGNPSLGDDVLGLGATNGFQPYAIAQPVSGTAVVAGDFDNDMDLDLYVVVSGVLQDQPNVLYLNDGQGNFTPVPGAGGAAGDSSGVGDQVSVADYDVDGNLDLFLTHGAGPGNVITDGSIELYRNLGNGNHWLQIDLEGTADNRAALGATVYVQAGGKVQMRAVDGGMHYATQNQARLHFGLGPNTTIDGIQVRWPDGSIQETGAMPADQVIRIHQADPRRVIGEPDIVPGVDRGTWVWKEAFDGPYRIRTTSDRALPVDLRVVADHPLAATPISLDAADQWSTTTSGAHLLASADSSLKGFDLQLPPQARVLLSNGFDGMVRAQDLLAGSDSVPLALSGWIVDSSLIEEYGPGPAAGQGLYLRSQSSGRVVQAFWDGVNGVPHSTQVSLFTAETPLLLEGRDLDSNDTASRTPTGITVEGIANVGTRDAVVAQLSQPVDIGLTWIQDGLFQPHRVQGRQLGRANAVELPRSTPYGDPLLDPGQDRAFAVWKDPDTGVWSLHQVAGSQTSAKMVGALISDQPLTSAQEVDLDPGDLLETLNPYRVVISFDTDSGDLDGVHLEYPPGTVLTLVQTTITGSEPEIRIGAERWPVINLPLELSGW